MENSNSIRIQESQTNIKLVASNNIIQVANIGIEMHELFLLIRKISDPGIKKRLLKAWNKEAVKLI